jgi:DNA-binding transcriptional MerR regulator
VVDKAPDAYRTISEVADDLDLPQHVLRFWETRFGQIRPLKRGGGRRYYRPEDIDLLKGIRHLLYGEGYTIRGVQRIIKESGVKAIQALGRGEGAAALQKPKGPEILDPAGGDDEPLDMGRPPALGGAVPPFAPASYGEPPFAAPRHGDDEDEGDAPDEPIRLEPVLAPRPVPVAAEQPAIPRHVPLQEAVRTPEPPPVPPAPAPDPRPVVRPADMPSMRPATPAGAAAAAPAPARLAADDVRRLQAALYELLECRKRLDAAFDDR